MPLYTVRLSDDSELAVEADYAATQDGVLAFHSVPAGLIRALAPGQWLDCEIEHQPRDTPAPDPYTQATLQSVCG